MLGTRHCGWCAARSVPGKGLEVRADQGQARPRGSLGQGRGGRWFGLSARPLLSALSEVLYLDPVTGPLSSANRWD